MGMLIRECYKRYFGNPEAGLLFLFLLACALAVVAIGKILAPVIASIVIAYLLQSLVSLLVRYNLNRHVAYLLVYTCFLASFVIAILVLLPLLWREISTLFTDLPSMLHNAKNNLLALAETYPSYFSDKQIETLASSILTQAQSILRQNVSTSLAYIPGIISWIVYLVLIPLLVFFFLKDAESLTAWAKEFLPRRRKILNTMLNTMDTQIGNYVRGTCLHVIILAVVAGLLFGYFSLNYSIILGVTVGLSALIPYIGAIAVTVPIVLIGYWQWGFAPELNYVVISYLVLQFLDGNVLVPLLFSKTVNLHPISIIVATLFFGAIWGFWGVFFAIPLATLIKTVMSVWPVHD